MQTSIENRRVIEGINPDSLAPMENLRERLAALLGGDLDFHGESSSYATHDLHAFAAKFPPQLPRAFILGLTEEFEVVLDPMMGSGTTIVEAAREGRAAIGLDIDPLAILLTTVKTSPLGTPQDVSYLKEHGRQTISRAEFSLSNPTKIKEELENRFDVKTKTFVDYWFHETTQLELLALILAIEAENNMTIRKFLEITFSSIIVTKSGGVSLARDLAHSRPHLDKNKTPKNALDRFSRRLEKNIKSIASLTIGANDPIVKRGDARRMPVEDNTVDLIVTSPPYANAIDYMRAHKFSLVWFREPITELTELRAGYIGSERKIKDQRTALPLETRCIVERLAVKDQPKAGILEKYFSEMAIVLGEMKRVLKNGCPAILVVGPSVMRGLEVPTHQCLAEIAVSMGFDVVGIARRKLDRNKRMMPARFGPKGSSLIEQRMHDEYVIGLMKP